MGTRTHLAAALAALVLLVGGCTAADRPDRPDPSVSPSPGAVPTTFGTVLSHSAPRADAVYVVTDGVKGCASCVSLWQRAGTDRPWQPVATLPRPKKAGYDDGSGPFPPVSPGALAMAEDGRHGYLAWTTDGVVATEDGGRTWQPVEGPERTARARGSVVIDGDQVLLSVLGSCADGDCPDELWRAPLGSVDWQKVVVPLRQGEGLFELHARDGVLNGVAVSPDGESLLRSTDVGETWTRVTPEPNPCAGCTGTCTPSPTGVHATVATCMTGDSWTDVVRISTDGRTWRDLVRPGAGERHGVTWVIAAEDGHFLVGTANGVLRVDPDGGAPTRVAGLGQGGHPGEIGFVTGAVGHLLGEQGRLLRTEDGGRTWTEIAPARSFGG
jgi:photosystem II stability/assembly factor-like uncharacterized protein